MEWDHKGFVSSSNRNEFPLESKAASAFSKMTQSHSTIYFCRSIRVSLPSTDSDFWLIWWSSVNWHGKAKQGPTCSFFVKFLFACYPQNRYYWDLSLSLETLRSRASATIYTQWTWACSRAGFVGLFYWFAWPEEHTVNSTLSDLKRETRLWTLPIPIWTLHWFKKQREEAMWKQ